MNVREGPLAKGLVLIVDDDPSLRLLAASALENAGYRVEEAENGESALPAFARTRPDIVLLDVMMPGIDGFETCRALRKLPEGKHAPILMMTGLEDVASIHRAYEAGATDFITKPINWVILAYRVAHLHRASNTFAELFRSETKNRALLNAIPDIVFRIGRNGTFLDVVAANDEELLRPRQAFVGKTVSEVLPHPLAEATMERIGETLRTGELQRLEYPLALRGKAAHFEARYVANGDEEVLCIIRNITERKTAERQALFHARRMELINRICTSALSEPALHDALGIMARDIRELLDLSHCAIRIFGYEDKTVAFPAPSGENGVPRSGVVREFPLTHQDAAIGVLQLGYAHARRRSEEEDRLGEALAHQVALAVRHILLFMDEQELAGRLLSLMNNLPGFIYRGLPDWSIDFVAGGQVERFSGYTAEELYAPSFSFFDIVHPDHVAELIGTMKTAVRERRHSLQLEYRARRSNGEYRWVSDNRTLVYDDDGRLLHVDGLMQDVNDRKAAQEAQARLEMAVEQAGESIVVTDTHGRIEYVNPAFERISGYSRQEAVGRTSGFLKSGQQDEAFYRDLWTTLVQEKDWIGRFVNRRKDGTLYQEESVISPVRNASGKVVNYVAVKRDVTNERVLEEQLRQSQKMEAVGRLAGGVAHDFNNILTAILGYADLLLARIPKNEPGHDDLQEIRKAGDRAANLTRQLLAFSRRQILQPKSMNLNDVVSGIDRLLQRLIGENIVICPVLAKPLGNVRIDPGQIEQVILNLAVNARDAMPGGGTLTIETANVEHGEGHSLRHRPIPPGPYVMLAITDQGTGMDEETRSRIFEPFFTTKELGKGTGLGLATVYGIVNQSGGHIWVYSEPGTGTTFKIYLPRIEEAAGAKDAPETPAATGCGETVLLVEDDPAVRNITRIVLSDGGYTVLEAANGEEGLAVARSHAGKIDLVVTDVVMPKMGGLELVDNLAACRPDAKVLFVSGYPEHAAHQNGTLSPGMSFLMKPFKAETILNKVRSVLDACTT